MLRMFRQCPLIRDASFVNEIVGKQLMVSHATATKDKYAMKYVHVYQLSKRKPFTLRGVVSHNLLNIAARHVAWEESQ